jgi:HSP20 family protein
LTSFLPGRSARAYPLLNVSEDGDHYYIEALAPGLNAESLKVSVVEDQLTIEGEKASPGQNVKSEAWHRNERSTGRFIRTLTLPNQVQQEKVSATYHNGLLNITLPKTEAAKPRQIAVTVA